jgi:hypothetical protein
MPRRSLRTARSDTLFGEVRARLPLFDDLPPDTLEHLATAGYGRGFLTASLRARLRKAGYPDLGHLAGTSPGAIARVRKFGPIRVELVRAFLLDEIARWLPGAREVHAAGATDEGRLARLRAIPVDRLPLDADVVAALGLSAASCADLAGRLRHDLLGTGIVAPSDIDGIVTALARLLGEGRVPAPQPSGEAPATDAQTIAAHRAALLARQDREWDEAAPAKD